MSERCGIADIAALAQTALPVVRVVVASVDGSTPREPGAAMLVTLGGTVGTIGGGQLEFEAIAHARAMLKSAEAEHAGIERHGSSLALSLDRTGRHDAPNGGAAASSGNSHVTEAFLQPVHERGIEPTLWLRDLRSWPLGPSLGQCCGGAVRVLFEHYSAGERHALDAGIAACGGTALVLRPVTSGVPPLILSARQQARELPLHIARTASDMLSGARPRRAALLSARKGAEAYFIEPVGAEPKPLFIYGAGHVGRAIARTIAELDFAVSWVDVNADRFPHAIRDEVRQIAAQDPAAIASAAPEGAYHLVLTFSHALDLAICHALLSRPIFGFLGLIGSETKRARFMKRLGEGGVPPDALARLTCPIGIGALTGKEPATIAISVAAQLIERLERERAGGARDTERTADAAKRLSA